VIRFLDSYSKKTILGIGSVLLSLSMGFGNLVSSSIAQENIAKPAPRAIANQVSSTIGYIETDQGLRVNPPLPDTLRVLAIRIDFQLDTLSTTTGNGRFYSEIPDSIEPEDWLIDPPPHDSAYFADQLLAARNYFHRYSRGQVTLTGLRNDGPGSGGDIHPGIFRMPYPIWHVNYGNDDNDRLNEKLIELFKDAWSAADSSNYPLGGYDIYIIFHAGAGNEFDTGADMTPHDIPSVYINDVDLDGGFPLPRHNTVLTEGIILPSMQRQGDIEVGMMGTVCANIGRVMGMPHLYNTENGDPGVGLFGLMDRGFGGFFGINPTPPNAWMRAFMGWDSVATVGISDTIRVGALYLPESVFDADPNLSRLVRVPINSNEYYLIEARHRDPDDDSLTFAYDRDGRVLTLKYDYSFEAEDGFRVPVRIEDHSFDLPASGMLIWHVDEGVIRDRLAEDKLQVDRYHRAVSLEEADGTEDIGEEYAFLQVGDGAEYGVREDAWYQDNTIWKKANNAYNVAFGPETTPSTVSNSGGASHLIITSFSEISDTMTAGVYSTWIQGDFPNSLPWSVPTNVDMIFGDLNGDTFDELIVYGENGTFWAFDSSGTSLSDWPNPYYQLADPDSFLVRIADMNNDINDELLIIRDREILAVSYEPNAHVGIHTSIFVDALGPNSATILAPADENSSPVIAALYHSANDPSKLVLQDSNFGAGASYIIDQNSNGTLVQIGDEWSRTVAVVFENGVINIVTVGDLDFTSTSAPSLSNGEKVLEPVSADFDGDGNPDIAAKTTLGDLIYWWGSDSFSSPQRVTPYEIPGRLRIADIDRDGLPEVTTLIKDGSEFVGIEPSGVWSEGTPIKLTPSQGKIRGSNILADFFGDDAIELLADAYRDTNEAFIIGFDLESNRPLENFPLDYGYHDGVGIAVLSIGQMDSDNSLEVAVASNSVDSTGSIRVYNISALATRTPVIHWGNKNRDRFHSRHDGGDYTSSGTTAGVNFDNAYIWPSPVKQDIAYLRFTSYSAGKAELAIYDLIGRRVFESNHSFTGTGDVEIPVDVSDLPSGVYVARIEAAGTHKLIRFGVVK